jgi:hypothetical protein
VSRLSFIPYAHIPSELVHTLTDSFFPPLPPLLPDDTPPPIPAFPPVVLSEITQVLDKSFTSTRPRLDSISFSIWKAIHTLRPLLLPYIITACLILGLHTTALYHSNGFILSKQTTTPPKAIASLSFLTLSQRSLNILT